VKVTPAFHSCHSRRAARNGAWSDRSQWLRPAGSVKKSPPVFKVEICLPLFEDIDQRLSAAVDISGLLKKWHCSLEQPQRLKQFAEKHDPSTSAAKACTEEKGFIAALKRCATQNQGFSANCKAGFILWLMARLEAAPFQNKIKTGVFSANC
jgi:hypothetical protein